MHTQYQIHVDKGSCRNLCTESYIFCYKLIIHRRTRKQNVGLLKACGSLPPVSGHWSMVTDQWSSSQWSMVTGQWSSSQWYGQCGYLYKTQKKVSIKVCRNSSAAVLLHPIYCTLSLPNCYKERYHFIYNNWQVNIIERDREIRARVVTQVFSPFGAALRVTFYNNRPVNDVSALESDLISASWRHPRWCLFSVYSFLGCLTECVHTPTDLHGMLLNDTNLSSTLISLAYVKLQNNIIIMTWSDHVEREWLPLASSVKPVNMPGAVLTTWIEEK